MLVAKVEIFLVSDQLPLESKALIVHLATVFLVRKGAAWVERGLVPPRPLFWKVWDSQKPLSCLGSDKTQLPCHYDYDYDYDCLQFHEAPLQSAGFIILQIRSFNVSGFLTMVG